MSAAATDLKLELLRTVHLLVWSGSTEGITVGTAPPDRGEGRAQGPAADELESEQGLSDIGQDWHPQEAEPIAGHAETIAVLDLQASPFEFRVLEVCWQQQCRARGRPRSAPWHCSNTPSSARAAGIRAGQC